MADTFKKKLTRWGTLATNMKALLPEMENVGGDHAAFEKLVTDGLDLVARQDATAAAASDIVARRLILERQGDHLREFLAAALRRKLGVGSRRLKEFGIRPREAKTRRRPDPDDLSTSPIPAIQLPLSASAGATFASES